MTLRVVIELDELTAARLEAAAAKVDVTTEEFAAHALQRGIADFEAWGEEEAAYADYQQTGEAIPLAAMEEWVKSWGTANELPPPKPCKSSS
jgi:predicted transcriptional regulator